jgi:tetratricopeptide (TPR) repeat protein
MRSTASFVLLVGVLIGAAASSADAQRKKPTETEIAQARKHFETAEQAKERGEYQTAAREYLLAYERLPEPEFLYNAGEVYRLAGDKQRALSHYRKYLELDPQGRGAASARVASEELGREIAADEEAARRRAAAEEARRKAEAERAAAAEDPPVVARPGRGLRIGGVATAGAGAAAIGLGVVFGLKASGINDEAAGWDAFDPARFADGEAAERNMLIFYGAGAALVVAGGVLYYLGHRAGSQTAETKAGVAFAPSLAPGAVTIAAVGRF